MVYVLLYKFVPKFNILAIFPQGRGRTLGTPVHQDIESDHESLRWRHNEHDSVSNHQPHDCLLNRLFERRSK